MQRFNSGHTFASWLALAPPAVRGQNRLESEPRATAFQSGLRAEVCDALWFLTQQWRTGEFSGEDAGSPITARAKISTTAIDRVRLADNDVQPNDPSLPLETMIEREPPTLDFRFALEAGRLWAKYLSKLAGDNTVSRNFKSDFRIAFPSRRPASAMSPTHIKQPPRRMQQRPGASSTARSCTNVWYRAVTRRWICRPRRLDQTGKN